MIETANAQHMAEQRRFALGFSTDDDGEINGVGGMMHVVAVTLLPGILLRRFSSVSAPSSRLYGAPWWFPFSAHQALQQPARSPGDLRESARQRLAIPHTWNSMRFLVSVRVRKPLSAWSGTPRAAREKDRGRYGGRWEPDRSITQLYIPGLSARRPDGSTGPYVEWSEVVMPVDVTAIPP